MCVIDLIFIWITEWKGLWKYEVRNGTIFRNCSMAGRQLFISQSSLMTHHCLHCSEMVPFLLKTISPPSVKHTLFKACCLLCHSPSQHCVSHCWRKPRYSQLSQSVTFLQVVNLASFPFILTLQKLMELFLGSSLHDFDDHQENAAFFICWNISQQVAKQ